MNSPMESFALFSLILLNCLMTSFCAYALARAVNQRDPTDWLSEKLSEWMPVVLIPVFWFLSIGYVVWGAFLIFGVVEKMVAAL